MLHTARLEIQDISKSFEGAKVLDAVDLQIGPGQVLGLIGENGAGKSTLLNILTGIVQPDRGTLLLDANPFNPTSYAEAARQGVSRVFQEQALIPTLRVYENLFLSHEARFSRFRQIMRQREMIDLAQGIVDNAGLGIDVRKPTSVYSFSKRQLLEIVRACLVPVDLLGIAHPIILLDEPTASLDKADEQIFFRLLERLRAQASFVFVSHRLSEVLELSDAIVVLKDGRVVKRLEAGEADERLLHSLMVGREQRSDYYHEAEQQGSQRPVVLEARELCGDGFSDVCLAVHEGEVLGIGGLLNSGKSELGKGLMGITPTRSGHVRMHGGDWLQPEISASLAAGCGYIPAERLVEGIVADFPVTWNMSMAGDDRFCSSLGIWKTKEEKNVAERMIAELKIRSAAPLLACRKLSGGNQQKVVLARWLCRDVRLLVLDNPTRGVDAGAKEEIYATIRQLTASGVAVILITDELLELIGMSDRIGIMQQGRLTTIVDAAPQSKPTEVEMIGLMLPGEQDLSERRAA